MIPPALGTTRMVAPIPVSGLPGGIHVHPVSLPGVNCASPDWPPPQTILGPFSGESSRRTDLPNGLLRRRCCASARRLHRLHGTPILPNQAVRNRPTSTGVLLCSDHVYVNLALGNEPTVVLVVTVDCFLGGVGFASQGGTSVIRGLHPVRVRNQAPGAERFSDGQPRAV